MKFIMFHPELVGFPKENGMFPEASSAGTKL